MTSERVTKFVLYFNNAIEHRAVHELDDWVKGFRTTTGNGQKCDELARALAPIKSRSLTGIEAMEAQRINHKLSVEADAKM